MPRRGGEDEDRGPRGGLPEAPPPGAGPPGCPSIPDRCRDSRVWHPTSASMPTTNDAGLRVPLVGARRRPLRRRAPPRGRPPRQPANSPFHGLQSPGRCQLLAGSAVGRQSRDLAPGGWWRRHWPLKPAGDGTTAQARVQHVPDARGRRADPLVRLRSGTRVWRKRAPRIRVAGPLQLQRPPMLAGGRAAVRAPQPQRDATVAGLERLTTRRSWRLLAEVHLRPLAGEGHKDGTALHSCRRSSCPIPWRQSTRTCAQQEPERWQRPIARGRSPDRIGTQALQDLPIIPASPVPCRPHEHP
mmetsp:Transcript_27906/g.81703  ORF Transcript_27906/g.81703 Transcript_27906/m.81703 type:complete len:300 (-) Transcript_27906:120-1019(-)